MMFQEQKYLYLPLIQKFLFKSIATEFLNCRMECYVKLSNSFKNIKIVYFFNFNFQILYIS